jgi:two-component system response regulator YesN
MANYINYDLSLDAISRHLQINPSYFSRIYKKETGQNFVEALTAIRMDKARSLLSSTSMKINEIAVSVGYQNSRYFWNIFKKANNCSPSEYRENRV